MLVNRLILRGLCFIVAIVSINQSVTAWAIAANNKTIAILDFTSHLKNQNPSIGQAAVFMFQTELLQSKQFQLMNRQRLRDAIKELGFSQTALADPNKALQIGKLASVSYLVTGEILSGFIQTSGTEYQVTEQTWAFCTLSIMVTEVETGQIVFSHQARGKSTQYANWIDDDSTPLLVEAAEDAAIQNAKAFLKNKQQENTP